MTCSFLSVRIIATQEIKIFNVRSLHSLVQWKGEAPSAVRNISAQRCALGVWRCRRCFWNRGPVALVLSLSIGFGYWSRQWAPGQVSSTEPTDRVQSPLKSNIHSISTVTGGEAGVLQLRGSVFTIYVFLLFCCVPAPGPTVLNNSFGSHIAKWEEAHTAKL